jgi:hypothetical protein
MKALQIISTAYRATLEEQDDTIVWLAYTMKGIGADLDVVLSGNAVNYGLKNQDASGLSFGSKKQTNPPDLAHDLTRLIEKGVRVLYIEDDVKARGVDVSMFIPGLRPVKRNDLARLMSEYDQVWYW